MKPASVIQLASRQSQQATLMQVVVHFRAETFRFLVLPIQNERDSSSLDTSYYESNKGQTQDFFEGRGEGAEFLVT